MPHVNLRGRFGYGRPRVYYGPGWTDVPEGLARALGLQGVERASVPTDPLADFPLLREAGFTDVEAVRAATDEELLAVRGIGAATLRRIRKAI